jgi:hypothetical protein
MTMRSCDGGGAAAAMAWVHREATKTIARSLMMRTSNLSKKRRAFSIVTQLHDIKMKRRQACAHRYRTRLVCDAGSGAAPDSSPPNNQALLLAVDCDPVRQ